MSKRWCFAIAFLAGLLFLSLSQAANNTATGKAIDCNPQYTCEDWGNCIDDFQTRTCIDIACGNENITERRVCSVSNSSCTPNIQCGDWGSCTYTGKAEDVFSSSLNFEGYQERQCIDLGNCAAPSTEERFCQEGYPVKFIVADHCGEKFLTLVDPTYNKPVTRINLASWRYGEKLELGFVQGDKSYCPTCSDGIKDDDEEGIDCGPSCSACKPPRSPFIAYFSAFLWIGSLSIFLTLIGTSSFMRIRRIHVLIRKGEHALVKQNTGKAKKINARLLQLFSDLSPEEKLTVKNAVHDYEFKVQHLSKKIFSSKI
ncbi:hypothetical protein KW787_00720 [Candidatus Pacearchaeota archaeon]|nr:hypothetical protein [Candidatus Pacearchaeota archaeon]